MKGLGGSVMQVPNEITINTNAAQCIKERIHWGYTTYFNICSNTQTNVQWGFVDYAEIVVVGVIGIVVVFLLIGLVTAMTRDLLTGGW